jgi:hypothetical protein
MKKLIYPMLAGILPLIISAQDLIQEDYQSPSKIIGDLENQSHPSSNVPISKNKNGAKDSTVVKLTVFLEGPFNQGKMNTDLAKNDIIPLTQPYNKAPWNYSGSESVSEIPSEHIVDWVLVDIRTADSAGAATSSTIFARKAGFLMDNGTIFNPDGQSLLNFDTVFS